MTTPPDPGTPHQNVTFPSNGGQAHGYLAVPPSGSGPGVVVIQEWWGLTDHIRDVTDRLAAEGFVALAPDLYGGHTTHNTDEAARMMQQLPVADAARDLAGAVDHLLSHEAVTSSKVGAVGFCMGGGFVLMLAATVGDRVGAAVPYYGIRGFTDEDAERVTAPVLGHFAGDDGFATPEQARHLQQILTDAGVDADIRIYEGAQHAFFNDTHDGGPYDPELAERTWRETVTFLHTHLGDD